MWVDWGKSADAELCGRSSWVLLATSYCGIRAANIHQVQSVRTASARSKLSFEPRKLSASRARRVRAKAIWPVMNGFRSSECSAASQENRFRRQLNLMILLSDYHRDQGCEIGPRNR